MRLGKTLSGHYNGHNVVELKFNGRIVWPIWSLEMSTNRMDFSAAGGSSTLYIVAAAYNENGTPIRRIELSASDLQIIKYGDSQGRISRNGLTFSAANLGTTPYDAVEGYFQITYAAKNLSIHLPFSQALNRIEQTIPAYTITTGLGALEFSPTQVPVLGGVVEVSAVRTYTLIDAEYIWSSTTHSGGAEHIGQTETVAPTTLICPTAIGSQGDTLTFASNAHQVSAIYHSVTAVYDGVSSSAYTLQQRADSYVTLVARYDYVAKISIIGSAGLTPAGGSCTLSGLGTKHTERTDKRWNSDGATELGQPHDVADSVRFEAFGTDASRFTISGDTVTHLNMQAREYDTPSFRCVNLSKTDVTDEITLTPIHNIAHPHSENVFALTTPYFGNVPFYGDESILFNYRSYQEAYTSYDSGYETQKVQTHLSSDLYTTVGTLTQQTTTAITGSFYLAVLQNSQRQTRDIVISMQRNSQTVVDKTLTQNAFEAPVDYIQIEESPYATYREIRIKNTHTTTLRGYVRCMVYYDSGEYLTFIDIPFNLAPGAQTSSQIEYSYGYNVYLSAFLQ